MVTVLLPDENDWTERKRKKNNLSRQHRSLKAQSLLSTKPTHLRLWALGINAQHGANSPRIFAADTPTHRLSRSTSHTLPKKMTMMMTTIHTLAMPLHWSTQTLSLLHTLSLSCKCRNKLTGSSICDHPNITPQSCHLPLLENLHSRTPLVAPIH